MKNNILSLEKTCYCIDCNKQLGFTSYWRKTKRCMSCAKKEYYKTHQHPKFKGGLPKCIDCGKQLSLRGLIYCGVHSHLGKKRPEHSQRMKGINNPMFGKLAHHGKWMKYKKIKMRSSWEVAYAEYLDKNKIKWLYESKTFNLGDTTYTPDFYLPEFNLYVEVKGWWRDDAKKKFKIFKRKYKDIKIKILNYKLLKNMEVI